MPVVVIKRCLLPHLAVDGIGIGGNLAVKRVPVDRGIAHQGRKPPSTNLNACSNLESRGCQAVVNP